MDCMAGVIGTTYACFDGDQVIDLQQPGHRGAPVPGGRAWRSLTCEEDASTS
jgi:hypothetical protein